MNNKFRLFVTVFVSLAAFIIMCVILNYGGEHKLLVKFILTMVVLVFGGILFLIIYFWYGSDSKCPSCKKPYSLIGKSSTIINRENISVLVETSIKDNEGYVRGSQGQYVPGERITYKDIYMCKRCGKECQSTYSKKVANI